ncbi:right-handed parallel beta-helix repeat-containing protein [Methanosphaera sp. WGK6]|uniref:right-handed parallel beta-helix repeat-containing protein n=1 Tax=Methanosphaera sp. WGK6 TaxID=1561964 RepID=UPI00084CDDE4|nr:right-handed parallel beta-helix repeat-containing protein [Methanosphaera sp. WGK6]OED30486.1 hypothetical protein NL43_02375 [Methanosphaera sp. WGK6]
MKTINKFLLITMVLFMVGLSCVSAGDTSNDINHQDNSLNKDISDVNTNITSTNDITSKTVKTIQTTSSDKNIVNTTPTKTIKQATTKITSNNYNYYFRFNETSNMTQTTSLVQSGDLLDLQGTFTNVNFTIDKTNITITSTGKTAKLYNCTVNIQGINSTGATVTNLTIENSNYYGSGIYVNVTKNILVANNTIHVNGPFAFAMAADQMNNSLIIDNYLETSHRTDMNRTHTALALGLSFYNNIVNNTVHSDQANGIYFSFWGSGLFQGGYCDYNNVTGNTVTGGDTSWSYCIQIMGTGNIISKNKVEYGYRGISTQDFTNNTIIGNEVNATAQGIYACEGAIVSNNIVHVNSSTTGIEIGGDGAILTNNTITSNDGPCIIISGSQIVIANNSLMSSEGYGIYSKGKYTNITIEGNNITSKKVGILFKKQSSSKKINYISVTKNRIQSYGYASIDFSEAGAKLIEDSHVLVDESNILNCSSGIGLELAYVPPVNGSVDDVKDSNKTIIITSQNYANYFSTDGADTRAILKNDTVILRGTFSGKDFVFPMKVHVIGQNCIIYNGSIDFTTDASASTLTNVTIINYDTSSVNRHGVMLDEVSNCVISNVTINNYDKWESFGIFLYSSGGNTIVNNTITTSGDYLNYNIFAYASDLNNISNNKVRLNQSSQNISYTYEIMFEDKIGAIYEVLHNYGIVAIYSSYNVINNNDVVITSNFKQYKHPDDDFKNSVVGIDIYYESDYNTVTNNKISVTSLGPYTYGMGVLGAPWGSSITSSNATNNTFRNNQVNVTGGYFATGFIAGLNSVNTLVENNTFNVKALHNNTNRGDYVYGLTLESCLNTTFIDNTINASGAAVYTIEMYGTRNNKIMNNILYAEASHPYGIAGYQSSYNTITGNTITTKQMPYGTIIPALHSDAIPYGDEGIMLMRNSFYNNITKNTIQTNASEYAVKLTEQAINNTVVENSLQSTKYSGDKAVYIGHKTNKVTNNFIYFTNIIVHPMQGTLGKPFNLTATVISTGTDLKNLTVTFRIGITQIGTAKVVNGKATITCNSTTGFSTTRYTIIATVTGNNFQNSTGTASLNFNKTLQESIVNVTKVTGLPGENVTITARVTDSYNAELTGNVTFIVNGETLTTKTLSTGRASYIYKIPNTMNIGVYDINVIYNGNKDHSSGEGSNILGVQTTTTTTVNSATGIIGNTTTIKATVTTSNGEKVNSGTVTIKINGDTVGTAKVSNGVATYKYTVSTNFVSTKKYSIVVIYNGNNTLKQSNATNTLTVQKTKSSINYNTTYTYTGNRTTLTIRVSDLTNSFFTKNGNISIAINGEVLKYTNNTIILGTSNNNGTIKFTFTAPTTLQGKNNITLTFYGNDQFNSSSKTFKNGLIILTGNQTTKMIYASHNGTGSGFSANSPTTLTDALTIVANGGTINLVTMNNAKSDTYSLTKPIVINTTTTTAKTIKIVGLTNKTIIFNGQNKNQLLNIAKGYTISITNVQFTKGNTSNGGAIYNNGLLTLSKVTFTNNYANQGGAIYNNGIMTITQSIFKTNSGNYGGVILNAGNLTMTSNNVTNNNATKSGGVINSKGNVTLKSNRFINNSAAFGGVLYASGKVNTITINDFISNHVTKNGGAIYNFGVMDLRSNNFTSNTATQWSGAVHNARNITVTSNKFALNTAGQLGGAMFNNANATMTSNTFENNRGKYGGAIYNGGVALIEKNTIRYNNASQTGGAVANKGIVTLKSNKITGNKAVYGGAIYSNNTVTTTNNTITYCVASVSGGAIYNIGNFTVNNNTFTGNSARNGGAIFNAKNATITKNIFTKNSAKQKGGAVYNSATMKISSNTFTGNTASTGNNTYPQ